MRMPGLFFLCTVASFSLAREAPPEVAPPGDKTSAKLQALSAGAKVLQSQSPPAQLDAYLVGLHPMKDHPDMQVEAHHYCRQVNADFAQCALFDGNTADANLNGIEYIISARLYAQLPEGEKRYWHPHNYEILSGQLVGPGLPDAAEKAFLATKMNSYGKTWHVWNTGHFGKNDADRLPVGDPELAWSFTRDGEALPGLVQRMEQRVGVDVGKKRKERRDLTAEVKPAAQLSSPSEK
ncbi:MAG TPA: OBAP family protein [Steroidobacteraceae bacterium]|nr:OBAP family protein [Steroidobacteraceae bacterium]